MRGSNRKRDGAQYGDVDGVGVGVAVVEGETTVVKASRRSRWLPTSAMSR